MITINIDISDHFQEFNEEFEAALARALERVGQKCAQYAQDLSPPPITGNLRNSITHTVENNRTLIVGSNVEYARYVETGTGIYNVDGMGTPIPWTYKDEQGNWHHTRGQRPQPYLKPAATRHTQTYKNIIDDEFKR